MSNELLAPHLVLWVGQDCSLTNHHAEILWVWRHQEKGLAIAEQSQREEEEKELRGHSGDRKHPAGLVFLNLHHATFKPDLSTPHYE